MTCTMKVRVVRCPKCCQLLPELADVPLYKCGGCGTILQAKKRQNDIKTQKAASQETCLSLMNDIEHVSRDVESSQEASVPSTGRHSLDQISGKSQNEPGDCNREQFSATNLSNEASSSAELTHHKSEESSVPTRVNSTVEHEKNELVHDLRGSGTEDIPGTTRDSNSMITSQKPIGESDLSETPTVCNLEPGKSQGSVIHFFDGVSSKEPVNSSSELSCTLKNLNLNKSSTNGSCYYAYDGSVSSYTGTDDQFPDQNLHRSQAFEVVDFADVEKRPKRGKLSANNSERERRAPNTFSVSSERDEFLYRQPFYVRNSPASYEFGSASKHGLDEFKYSSTPQSLGKYESVEQDKAKLLKMVWELKDQLNRRDNGLEGHEDERNSGGVRVTWKEKQIPGYRNCKLLNNEICPASNYHFCPRSCGRVKNCPQQRNFRQMSFSGEAANNRLQVDHCCCPHKRRWSVQTLPPFVCCDKRQYRAHAGHYGHSVYGSTPSSPLQDTNSKFHLRRHIKKSNDSRRQDYRVMNSHLREEYPPVKRHLRSVMGGAPFITCYRCWELLQLPLDFPLFRGRRCHQLRCSACSEVLKFSLENRSHIVPHTSRSEVVDDSNYWCSASASHANYPVSCSDDNGLSFGKSRSTEDKTTPLFQDIVGNEKTITDSSFEPTEDRKENLILEQTQSKCKDPAEAYEPNKSKMNKFSTETEAMLPTRSPLHRLMGYSSPTAVINGYGAGTSSHHSE